MDDWTSGKILTRREVELKWMWPVNPHLKVLATRLCPCLVLLWVLQFNSYKIKHLASELYYHKK